THSKIYSLAEEFNQLKTFYQTNNDYELELKKTFEIKESSFKNNIAQHTINENNEEQEINEEVTICLDQQENE
ncbi:9792_t:CDS:2, partial [Racocetra persica]